jgi:hypothetical protein
VCVRMCVCVRVCKESTSTATAMGSGSGVLQGTSKRTHQQVTTKQQRGREGESSMTLLSSLVESSSSLPSRHVWCGQKDPPFFFSVVSSFLFSTSKNQLLLSHAHLHCLLHFIPCLLLPRHTPATHAGSFSLSLPARPFSLFMGGAFFS